MDAPLLDLVRDGLCLTRSGLVTVVERTVQARPSVRVVGPGYLLDGTMVEFYVSRVGDRLEITDHGIIMMALEAGGLNLDSEALGNRLARLLSYYAPASSIESGVLRSLTSEDDLPQAMALFSYAVAAVGTLMMDAEQSARLSFQDEVGAVLESAYSSGRITRGWCEREHDRKGAYRVDFKVGLSSQQGMVVSAVQTTNKIASTALAFAKVHEWCPEWPRVVICRDWASLGPLGHTRLEDHADWIIPELQPHQFHDVCEELLVKYPPAA